MSGDIPEKELVIPGHLEIAVEAATRLNSGEWSTNEVLIAGLSDLESFVRTQPGEFPIIDAGPLEQTPITKFLVNEFEKLSQTAGGSDSFGYRAITQIGLIVAAVKTLEVQVQQLGSRITELEKR
ncbi:hypothetical protein [Mycobacteroides abscessus]|uniref:hypothetical protein n=1 Tax=Mycobacteroides abscessus TaxID=36809 RepID=UPI0021074BFF|nr:hypothetical protein [Mycobacteroides abscessus]